MDPQLIRVVCNCKSLTWLSKYLSTNISDHWPTPIARHSFWPLTKQPASLGSIREKTLYKRHSDCNLHNNVNHLTQKPIITFPAQFCSGRHPWHVQQARHRLQRLHRLLRRLPKVQRGEINWKLVVWGLGGCGAVAWVSEWVEAMERRPREEVNMELLRIL